MEKLEFKFKTETNQLRNFNVTAGVVNSGNLEILLEKYSEPDGTGVIVNTTVPGFKVIWQAVIQDFIDKYAMGGCHLIINDCGATPAVVSLRLRQLYELAVTDNNHKNFSLSRYFELTARERILALIDTDSFIEILPAITKLTSPHLGVLDLPTEFDDGVIIGRAKFNNQPVFIAAQNFAFMGGAVGEVNGAKLTGLCLKALNEKPSAVIFLLDSGGVRLHEANAGEIAISELIAAIMQLKFAQIPVIGVVAGKNGAFGGIGIISQCLDSIIVTENARTGVSGPEVIETVMGVVEYDSSDRALVWRTCGGRHRAITGDGIYCGKSIVEIKSKLIDLLSSPQPLTISQLQKEQQLLAKRLQDNQNSKDGGDVWAKAGYAEPLAIPDLSDVGFMGILK